MHWGTNVDSLKEPATNRIFRAWVEDWELEAIRKQDPVNEAKILQKYKNLVFHDWENGGVIQTIYDQNLEWYRKSRAMNIDVAGYYLISVRADNDEECSWEINQEICDYIAEAEAEQPEGVKIIRKDKEAEEVVVD